MITRRIFLSVLIWGIPLLILIGCAVFSRKKVLTILCRFLYLPYLLFMGIPLFWFWGGDGIMNLWLVPLVFIASWIISLRFVLPRMRWVSNTNRFDVFAFFLTLSGIFTFVLVGLIYVFTGRELVIM